MSQQWIPTVDPASGKTYYFNPVTRQTSWTLPGAAPPPPPPPAAMPRWQEGIDPNTGKKYYIDHVNHTTTWDRPAGVEIAPANVPVTSPQASPATSGFGGYGQPQQPAAAATTSQSMFYPQPAATYTSQIQPQSQSMIMPQQSGFGAQPVMSGMSMMGGMPFSSSRPMWQDPPAGDAVACSSCGAQLGTGFFSSKKLCKCCTRQFCENCLNNKNVVPSQGPKPVNVCPACHNHLGRSDQRCLCRVVPYLAQPDMGVRIKALDELCGLSNGAGYGPEDFFAAGIPRELKLIPLTDPQLAGPAIILMGFCCQFPKAAESMVDDTFLKALVDYGKLHIEADPNIPRLIAQLATRCERSRPSLMKLQVLPVLQKGLTASNIEVMRQSAEALSAMFANSAGGQSEDEAALMLALVPVLERGDNDVRNKILTLISSLANNPGNRMAFISADGIPALGRILSAADPNKALVLDIFFKFAEQEETVDCLAPFVSVMFGIIGGNGDTDSQRAAAKVLLKLCNSERLKRVTTEAMLLEQCGTVARLLGSADGEARKLGVEMALSAMKANPEIAPARLVDGKVVTALAGLVRSNQPESCQAITCLAMCVAREPKAGDEVADPAFCGAVVRFANSMDKDVVTALWALTGHPEVATLCAAHQDIFSLIQKLITSGDKTYVGPACYIVSNLCIVRDFAKQLENGYHIVQHISSILSNNVAELQVPALTAVSALANEPTIANQFGSTPMLPSLMPKLMKAPSAEVSFHACATAAVLCETSDQFRINFYKNDGLRAAVESTTSADSHICERATFILYVYASKKDADRAALREDHGIEALLDVLFATNPDAKVHAVTALRFYAQPANVADIRQICDAGGIVSMSGLLSSDNPVAMIGPAAETLLAFITVDEKCRMSAYDASVLGMMVKLLQDCKNERLIQTALAVIDNLLNVPDAATQFCQDGMLLLPQLLENPNTKESALHLITRLSSSSPAALETYVELSGIGALVSLLSSPNADAQFRASELFARFATLPGKRQELLGANCLPSVNPLLGPSTSDAVRLNAVRGLAAMSEDPVAQDAISANGTVPLLIKLIDSPSDEVRGCVLSILSRMSMNADVVGQMSTPETVTVLARCLVKAGETPMATTILRLIALLLRQNPDTCEIVERECLVQIVKQQLFNPDNTSEAMDLLFEVIMRRPAASKVVLDPENIKAVSLIFALAEPGNPLCQQAVAVLYAVSVNCADMFSAAASSFSFDVKPLLVIASQQTTDPAQQQMAMQALQILSALSKNTKHRQVIAQSSLADTLLSILTSASSEANKTAALSFASELSGSEAFRMKACANKTMWLGVFVNALNKAQSAAEVVQAENALLRLSVNEEMREQVSMDGSELMTALVPLANSDAADKQEAAALAITVLASYDLLDQRALSNFTRSVFSRAAPCPEVKNSLVQVLGSLGTQELLGVFSTAPPPPPAAAALPPPPPPASGGDEAPAAAAAAAVEGSSSPAPESPVAAAAGASGEMPPPPPPPPFEAAVRPALSMSAIDVGLVSLFCKGVGECMLHVRDMIPSFFHAAFAILYTLSRSDKARAQIRTDLTPESLRMFSDAVAGFSYDALRLANAVGSL